MLPELKIFHAQWLFLFLVIVFVFWSQGKNGPAVSEHGESGKQPCSKNAEGFPVTMLEAGMAVGGMLKGSMQIAQIAKQRPTWTWRKLFVLT